jgi:spermidine synthase
VYRIVTQDQTGRLRRAVFGAACLFTLVSGGVGRSENLIDHDVRASIMKSDDGRIAYIETKYNNIFITKYGSILMMSFGLRGREFNQSETNLADPDDLPLRYTQVMTMAVAYADSPKRILLIGLGGGSMSTYLARFMPDAAITTVEIDPGVIKAAKQYFGVLETERVRYVAADGRAFLRRSLALYDLILVDAYLGNSVPFHLLTKEFYTLIKQRLTPLGAAAFNVRRGTKLHASTLRTLKDVFLDIHVLPVNDYQETVVVANSSRFAKEGLAGRVVALQERYRFRYPLSEIPSQNLGPALPRRGKLLTDDFAPVEFYNTLQEQGDDPG